MIRINIRGMLTREPDPFCEQSYSEIREAIDHALAGNDEIVLDIDSHGGDSIGVKALADYVFANRERIAAHVSGVCASAAYYIAAACRRITAAEDAIVGSVGTIGWPPDVGDAKVATLSPLKNSGDDLQAILDDGCERFLRDIARYRNFSGDLEEIAQQVGAGAMLTAREALSRNLIDEVSNMDDEANKTELDVEGIAAMLPKLLEKIDQLAEKVDSADERVGLLEQRLDELKKVDENEAAAACDEDESKSEDVVEDDADDKDKDEIMACLIDAAKAAGLIRASDETFARRLAMASPALFRDFLTSRPKAGATSAKLSMAAKSHEPVARTRNERAKQIMQTKGCDYATALAECITKE